MSKQLTHILFVTVMLIKQQIELIISKVKHRLINYMRGQKHRISYVDIAPTEGTADASREAMSVAILVTHRAYIQGSIANLHRAANRTIGKRIKNLWAYDVKSYFDDISGIFDPLVIILARPARVRTVLLIGLAVVVCLIHFSSS
jgi:hypothetical protein